MHRGFIPLHRKIKDNWIYDDCSKFGAWCKILMEVNHKPNKKEIDGEIVTCGKGSSINSLATWAIIFGKGWTIAKVRTFFKMLQKDSMIVVEGLRKTTRVTVCNYESYNNTEHTDSTQIAHRQHTDSTQIATNNNDNNVNNDKNGNIKHTKKKYGEFKNVLLTIEEYDRLKTDWGESERERMLKIFSEGLQMKKYSYKDHNLAIRKWKSNEKGNQKQDLRTSEGLNANYSSGI